MKYKEIRRQMMRLEKSIEVNIHIKTQIEEAKRVEELLKNKVNGKEESCHKLEVEVVYLRNKVDKSNKVLNSSTILNEILDSQRSPNDKSGLGYNKEATHFEASTSKKLEVSPSFSKDGNNVAIQPSTQGKETFKITKQGRHQEAIFTPQRKTEERHLQDGHQSKAMKMFFMVIVTHVINMVTKLWNANIIQGEIMKDS
jgi:hypothetical protein